MASMAPEREIKIGSTSIAVDDVKNIFSRLERIVHQLGEQEIAGLKKPTELTKKQWDERKSNVKRDAFRVTATIVGSSGDVVHDDKIGMFDLPDRPIDVSLIYMTNITAYNWVAKAKPTRSFELWLDFSKSKLLDSERFVSSPTLNTSRLKIASDKTDWIAVVSEAVVGVISEKKNKTTFLHQAFVYDLGLFLVGLPFAFYLAWKLSGVTNSIFSKYSQFLEIAANVYVMLVAISLYRVLFGYTKWAFPSMELKENARSVYRHRAIWGLIVIGLAVNFITDLIHKL